MPLNHSSDSLIPDVGAAKPPMLGVGRGLGKQVLNNSYSQAVKRNVNPRMAATLPVVELRRVSSMPGFALQTPAK